MQYYLNFYYIFILLLMYLQMYMPLHTMEVKEQLERVGSFLYNVGPSEII